jgi:hypothetical protein
VAEPTVLLNFRVPQSWLAAMDSAANAKGMKRSAWARRVIERGLVGAGELPDPRVVAARVDPEVETRFKRRTL